MKTKVISDLPRATQEKYVRAVYGKWQTEPPTEPGLYKALDKSGGVFWALDGAALLFDFWDGLGGF